MKNLLSILICMATCNAYCQKYDYHWIMGYRSTLDSVNIGNFNILFTESSADTSYEHRNVKMEVTQVTISDSMGDLQFFTNGAAIFNRLNDKMENGDSINYGFYWNQWGGDEWRPVQSMICLPRQNGSNVTDVFHLMQDHMNVYPFLYTPFLHQTIVDMNANIGLGSVLQKNVPLIVDSLEGSVTACRHANGRDWWMFITQSRTGCYHRFLFSEGQALIHDTACIGTIYTWDAGQITFSPDGEKMARVGTLTGIDIYDFDRCTGGLSNFVNLPVYYNPDSGIIQVGLAFSPNSRFLYNIQSKYIIQFDLDEIDVMASADTVGYYTYDSTLGITQPVYFIAQLAPDGKIYVSSNNSIKFLHVINRPDEKGDSCLFVKKGLPLPRYNTFGIHNYPNYRLGPIDGSACDTLGINNPTGLRAEKEKQLRIFPNPAHDQAVIDYGYLRWEKYSTVTLELTNEAGQLVHVQELPPYSGLQKVEVSQWTAGIYTATVKGDGRMIAVEKLTKL